MAKTFTVKDKQGNVVKPGKEVADEILLQAVTQYKELLALAAFQAAEMKKKMEAPRRIIEAACLVAPGNKIIAPNFRASFVENKSIDLDTMIKAIGRKRLAPYISESIDKVAVTKALGEKEIEPFLVGTGVRQLRVS